MSIDMNQISKLGFGLMRLPQADGKIDIPQVCELVDTYLAAGFNYFDTAYIYEGSEVATKEALVSRHPRESFMLATKLPGFALQSRADCEGAFHEQLERTGAGYFDFYLLHSIEDGNYSVYTNIDSFAWGQEKKKEGKIRHLGFSFHGTPELLERVLEEHPEMEFVQIQLNYADWDSDIIQSRRLYEILCKYDKPMIIMEPVKGGILANVTPEIEGKLKAADPTASPASWALRFAGGREGIMTVLSGMSDMAQLRDNIATFSPLVPLTDAENATLDEVVQLMRNLPLVPCTKCRYCCEGCPANIKIPDVFSLLNELRMFPDDFRAQIIYAGLTRDSGRAKDCIACSQCEGVCPQHLPIIELLGEASERFDNFQFGPPDTEETQA